MDNSGDPPPGWMVFMFPWSITVVCVPLGLTIDLVEPFSIRVECVPLGCTTVWVLPLSMTTGWVPSGLTITFCAVNYNESSTEARKKIAFSFINTSFVYGAYLAFTSLI